MRGKKRIREHAEGTERERDGGEKKVGTLFWSVLFFSDGMVCMMWSVIRKYLFVVIIAVALLLRCRRVSCLSLSVSSLWGLILHSCVLFPCGARALFQLNKQSSSLYSSRSPSSPSGPQTV